MALATFLTIVGGKLVADLSPDSEPNLVEITSAEDLAALDTGGGFFVSSSLDFPEEYTSDPAVLALVKLVRS